MAINKAVLAAMRAAGKVAPDIRQSYKAIRVAEDVIGAAGLVDPRCRIEDVSVQAPDGYAIPCRVFTPLDIDFSWREWFQVSEDFAGTILFFHGGGWANGDVDYYSDSCVRTAVRLARRVVSVEYRRSPEYQFPQAVLDCYEVARQLFAGTLLPDVCQERIVLFGDSAGGNLTAAVSLMARDKGEFLPRTQMLLYPAVNDDYDPATSPFDSLRENGEGYLLSARDIQGYMDMYAPDPAQRSNPYCAPLLAGDLSHQPRTLVMTAEYCPLRDEGEEYARRLAAAGNEVSCVRILDAVHGYFLYPSVLNLVRDTYKVMERFLDGCELVQEGDAAWVEIPGTD